MNDFSNHILLVADTPSRIRPCDVYRLFDALESSQWDGLRDYLLIVRPDLSVECDFVMEELATA